MRIESTRVTHPPVTAEPTTVPQTTKTESPGVAPAESAQQQESQQNKAKPQSAQTQQPELEIAVEKMNRALRAFNHALQFEVSKTNRIIVRVIDTDSGEIIRQIPPEDFMETFHRMEDAIGILIDRRV